MSGFHGQHLCVGKTPVTGLASSTELSHFKTGTFHVYKLILLWRRRENNSQDRVLSCVRRYTLASSVASHALPIFRHLPFLVVLIHLKVKLILFLVVGWYTWSESENTLRIFGVTLDIEVLGRRYSRIHINANLLGWDLLKRLT